MNRATELNLTRLTSMTVLVINIFIINLIQLSNDFFFYAVHVLVMENNEYFSKPSHLNDHTDGLLLPSDTTHRSIL